MEGMSHEMFDILSQLQESKMKNETLQSQIASMNSQLQNYKNIIESLAIENSTINQSKKSKSSIEFREKWKFYHEHKDDIMKTRKIDAVHWNEIKKISDEMYLKRGNS